MIRLSLQPLIMVKILLWNCMVLLTFSQEKRIEKNICDVVSQGTTFDPMDPSNNNCEFFILDPKFSSFIPASNNSDSVLIEVMAKSNFNIFHEGPVLFDDALYFVTNRLGNHSDPTWGESSEPPQLNQFINILRFDIRTREVTNVTTYPQIIMANGMAKSSDGANILALSQGYNGTGGAIYRIEMSSGKATRMLDSYFGAKLNSPNDIKMTNDGIIFFSDPVYGFEQGFRGDGTKSTNDVPLLGGNIYRYDTNTRRMTVLVTGLQRPNGVALFDDRKSGNGCTLFLSDTGFEDKAQSPRGFVSFGDSAVYSMKDDGGHDGCFDTEDGPWTTLPLVPAVGGIQDGMMVHDKTELLFFCNGLGLLWIWSIRLHQEIGLVRMPNGKCTQVVFSQDTGDQTIYVLAETRLYSFVLNLNPKFTAKSGSVPVLKPFLWNLSPSIFVFMITMGFLINNF